MANAVPRKPPVFCLLVLLLATFSNSPTLAKSVSDEDLKGYLNTLRLYVGNQDQNYQAHLVQKLWQKIVETASIEQLPVILGSMDDPVPLTKLTSENAASWKKNRPLIENWVRAAVDTIAERELAETGTLPSDRLEEFVLDNKQSPRARRVAYEWLSKVDADRAAGLLTDMLDDESLELRYDAIASLLAEAKAAGDETAKLAKYQRALRSARDKLQLKECAEALKELGQTPNMAKQVGFLIDWKVIGPFDNSQRAGFEREYPPEQGVDLDATYEGKDGSVAWKDAVAEQEDLESLGTVDLNAALVEEKSVLAYSYTTFRSAKEQPVEIRYESKEATKLWLNDKLIATKNVYHSGGGFDQYIVPCLLQQGENRILIKVCQNEQTQPWTRPWEFRLRITDDLGGAIQPAE